MKAISLKSRLAVLAAVGAALMAVAPNAFAAQISDTSLKCYVSELERPLVRLRQLELGLRQTSA